MTIKQLTGLFAQSYLFLIFLAALFALAPLAKADEARPLRLADHIQKRCQKGCVDADLLQDAVQRAAEETRVDPRLILAVIDVESGFRDKAKNTVNGRSMGLMQIQVYWHKEKFRTKNYLDVFENVRAGAQVLENCGKKEKGHTKKTLVCYNGYQVGGMLRYAEKVVKVWHSLKKIAIV